MSDQKETLTGTSGADELKEKIKTAIHLASFWSQGCGSDQFWDMDKVIGTLMQCREYIDAKEESPLHFSGRELSEEEINKAADAHARWAYGKYKNYDFFPRMEGFKAGVAWTKTRTRDLAVNGGKDGK